MFEIMDLGGLGDPAAAAGAAALERGAIVRFPVLPFAVSPDEQRFFDPSVLKGGAKNASYDPATGRVGGAALQDAPLQALGAMMRRYLAHAERVLQAVAPDYAERLQPGRTSFRPGAIETRALSPRKDDKRLHVDAFPSSPVQGRRILRVFTNADPAGGPRIWRVGEEGFEAFAQSFAPQVRPRPWAGLLERAGLTRGRRTPYDSAMLQLHDAAKLDDRWQARAPARTLSLAAGSTWAVFTDAVLHAALSGQHAFEQTFLLPVEAMEDPSRSPLRVLERLTGGPLL